MLDNTTINDSVLDSTYSFESDKSTYVWWLFRKNCDFYWFLTGQFWATHGKVHGTPYQYDIEKVIEYHKPKLIGTSHRINNTQRIKDIMHTSLIRNNYTVSEKYPDLLIRKQEKQ